MKSACTAAILLLLSGSEATPQGSPAVSERAGPGPQAPVAGMVGYRSISRVEHARAPGRAMRLEVVTIFPDRCRWHRSWMDGDPRIRDTEFRFGERVFLLPELSAQSREPDAGESDLILLRMEMRRAAMCWPDGFDWSDPQEGGRLLAEVRRLAGKSESERIGTLHARLDESGSLAELHARSADGAPRETLEIDSWMQSGERSWPQRMHLRLGEELIWQEEVLSVLTRVRRMDLFFLPPDRRPKTGASASDQVWSMDFIACTFRAVPLEADASWDEALSRHADLLEDVTEELEPLELEPDPIPTFELDEEGRPTSCLLRLRRPASDPPEGWQTVEERAGLALRRLPGPEALDAARIAALRGAVPPEARPGTPYVRLFEVQGRRWLDLYMPLSGTR
jgi:hypothetical protein